jgi:hypothetical protein
MLEWTGFEEADKTWQQLKLHFEEAYELCLAAGQGTSAFHGYVNSAEGAVDDDNSITTIQESLNSIHMANNANYANLQEHLQAARAETAALRAELATAQQSMANFTQASIRAPVPPVLVQYVQGPPPALAPPQQGYGYQYGGRGSRNTRRGGGRGYSRGTTVPPVPPVPTAPAPPTNVPRPPGNIPPPPPAASAAAYQQQRQNPAFSNTTKRYNNWNMCATCGWDVMMYQFGTPVRRVPSNIKTLIIRMVAHVKMHKLI